MKANTLKQIREEANHNKDCFTRFSFQAITVAATGIGLIINFSETRYIEYIGILVLWLTMFVSRIGNHKYATANRNFSYELHLGRIVKINSAKPSFILEKMSNLNWEEAMFSWRIVQSILYNNIYKISSFSGHNVRKEIKVKIKYKWWNTHELIDYWRANYPSKIKIKRKQEYHAGAYLKNMQINLFLLGLLALAPLSVHSYNRILAYVYNSDDAILHAVLPTAILISTTIFGFWRMIKDRKRRIILESELLSIQSSSIVWRCATMGYCLAEHRATKNNRGYHKFTRYLCEAAEIAAENLGNIHEWMEAVSELENPDDFWNLKKEIGKADEEYKVNEKSETEKNV